MSTSAEIPCPVSSAGSRAPPRLGRAHAAVRDRVPARAGDAARRDVRVAAGPGADRGRPAAHALPAGGAGRLGELRGARAPPRPGRRRWPPRRRAPRPRPSAGCTVRPVPGGALVTSNGEALAAVALPRGPCTLAVASTPSATTVLARRPGRRGPRGRRPSRRGRGRHRGAGHRRPVPLAAHRHALPDHARACSSSCSGWAVLLGLAGMVAGAWRRDGRSFARPRRPRPRPVDARRDPRARRVGGGRPRDGRRRLHRGHPAGARRERLHRQRLPLAQRARGAVQLVLRGRAGLGGARARRGRVGAVAARARDRARPADLGPAAPPRPAPPRSGPAPAGRDVGGRGGVRGVVGCRSGSRCAPSRGSRWACSPCGCAWSGPSPRGRSLPLLGRRRGRRVHGGADAGRAAGPRAAARGAARAGPGGCTARGRGGRARSSSSPGWPSPCCRWPPTSRSPGCSRPRGCAS